MIFFRKFKIKSSGKFDYKILPCTVNSFTFQIMATNDCHVALMSTASFEDKWIEVCLGGWGNTESFIAERVGDRKG